MNATIANLPGSIAPSATAARAMAMPKRRWMLCCVPARPIKPHMMFSPPTPA